MKKVASVILLCVIIIFGLTGCEFNKNIPKPMRKSDTAFDAKKTDNSLEFIRQKGEIVIGVQISNFPVCYKNENGDIDGFEIDIAKAVAQVMNIKAEFKAISPDNIISELNSNSIDFAWSCATSNSQSHELILHSNPYFKSGLIFAVDSLSGIKSADELKGKTVGLKSSGAAYESFSQKSEVYDLIKESNIKKYNDDFEALSDLEKGKINAVILDKLVFNYYTKDKKDAFYILNEVAEEREYSVGSRPGDKALMMELDSAIQKIKDNGTANIISQNWFGDNIVN